MHQVEHFVPFKVTFYFRSLGKLLFASLEWLPWNQHSASLASWQTTAHSAHMWGRRSLQWGGRREWEKWQLWYKGAKNGGDSCGRWEREARLHACHSIDFTTGTSLADNPPGHWPWQFYRGNLYAERNCSLTMSPICLPQKIPFFPS